MLTDKELQVLLNQVDRFLQPRWQELADLKHQLEEISNAKGEGPKTSKSRSKRVQSTEEDS